MPYRPGFTTVQISKSTLARLREVRRKIAADQNRDMTMADVVEVLANEYSNQDEHAESVV